MKRAALTVVATIVGLVLLLGFKSHGGGPTSRVVALSPAVPGGDAPTASSSPRPSTRRARRSGSRPGAAATRPRSVTGSAVQTRYGLVQVRVTISGHRIKDIEAIQLPQSRGRDIQIDNEAVPLLRSEALAAQSARIDIISGATYTSDGYAQSLQSALDRAGL